MLGAHLAAGMDLGRSLAVLTFAGTVIVVLLVCFDVPGRLNRLADPDGTVDHLAEPAQEPESARSVSAAASK